MKELKPCPFRVCGRQAKSLTIEGEYYYNEYFMPCMGDKCACYEEFGKEIRCMRDNMYLIIGEQED